jgi:hypothetical protein
MLVYQWVYIYTSMIHWYNPTITNLRMIPSSKPKMASPRDAGLREASGASERSSRRDGKVLLEWWRKG